MPTSGTQRTALRIEPDLWDRFGRAAVNRSAVLRAFIAWYVREEGAKLPRRPDPA